eukprot:scaffold223196_cov30-Cyclotella_meneghiniana.AAC.1
MQMKAGDAMQMDGANDPLRHPYSYLQCIARMVGETHKDDMNLRGGDYYWGSLSCRGCFAGVVLLCRVDTEQ